MRSGALSLLLMVGCGAAEPLAEFYNVQDPGEDGTYDGFCLVEIDGVNVEQRSPTEFTASLDHGSLDCELASDETFVCGSIRWPDLWAPGAPLDSEIMLEGTLSSDYLDATLTRVYDDGEVCTADLVGDSIGAFDDPAVTGALVLVILMAVFDGD